jgi:hypothetical protein
MEFWTIADTVASCDRDGYSLTAARKPFLNGSAVDVAQFL